MKPKFNLKIFQIDKSYYEFKEKSDSEIIDIIKKNHENKLRHKYEDKILRIINPQILNEKDADFEFWSYCYNQPKEKYYWKLFLPEKLSETHNFDVVEFSFILFMGYKGQIYCVISGSGMSVIKKFINTTFGIEIYQRLAKTKEDVIVELETRGIASNISHHKQIFTFNQTIAETIEYSDIPTKIKLKIRKELKDNEFEKYDLDEAGLIEVGAYFSLRKSIDFTELKDLVVDIHKIREERPATQLTLFQKINDPNLVNELDERLKEIVVDDVISHNLSHKAKQSDVIEVVHPSKLERFYECDHFRIRAKFSRGGTDVDVTDKHKLYFESTKHIFDNLKNIGDRNEVKGKLYTLHIVGLINGKDVTYGNFFSHITAEIIYLGKKYFKIDGHWYLLEDEFLKLMNKDAKDYYEKYKLDKPILNKWNNGDDEDTYNKSHSATDCFVLDKVITGDNVELCDLLIVKDDAVFFVHVKDGFNAKMRDLYIQVVLSAKRLSNDLKDNVKSSYIDSVIELYNYKNPLKKINKNELIKELRENPSKISFVMAFNNHSYKSATTAIEKIELSQSNIAKYSLVQVVKEMQQYQFGIKLIDISEL